MSREKHEHHDGGEESHDHKRRNDDDHDHGGKQPDAGVRAHGGRFGDEEMADIKGRILGISVHGDESEIIIAAGRAEGVYYGMEGYIMNGDTFLTELSVVGVTKHSCRARVQATPDQIREHLNDVVINPSSKPARAAQKAHDWKTRIIRVDIHGGHPRIMIAGGRAYGVEAGMEILLLDESGKKMGHATLEEASARTALATLDFPNLDMVHAIKTVVVNPG